MALRAQAAEAPAAGRERVFADQPALIRLRESARQLSLDALRARALRGGNYLSHFKGRGMEFDEARLYQDGDDPRSIDWRLTARAGKVYTKLFREERERPVYCWVDLRASMKFATRGVFKSVQAARLASLLAWATAQHSDRIGGFIFDDAERIELRPRSGNRAVLRLIHQLAALGGERTHAAGGENTLELSMAGLRRVARPGSLVTLMSDFRGMTDMALRHLAAISRHNDVIVMFITDPLESVLPPPGRYPVTSDGSTFVVDTASDALRKRYTAEFEARRDTLRRQCERNRIRWVEVSTVDDPLQVLQQLLGRVR